MIKRILDADWIKVDYHNDGAPFIRVYQFHKGKMLFWDSKTLEDFVEVKHGRWEVVCKNVRKCSNCKTERNTDEQRGWYSCPFCGCIMDLPRITKQTQAALEAMGRKVHKEE